MTERPSGRRTYRRPNLPDGRRQTLNQTFSTRRVPSVAEGERLVHLTRRSPQMRAQLGLREIREQILLDRRDPQDPKEPRNGA